MDMLIINDQEYHPDGTQLAAIELAREELSSDLDSIEQEMVHENGQLDGNSDADRAYQEAYSRYCHTICEIMDVEVVA